MFQNLKNPPDENTLIPLWTLWCCWHGSQFLVLSKRCSLMQSLHVYDYFCYWEWNLEGNFAPLPPLPGALPLDAAVDELQLLVEEVVRVVGRLQGQPGDRRPRLPPASNYDLYWAGQKNLVKGCRQTLDCYCISCELLSTSIADALLRVSSKLLFVNILV